MVRPGRIGQAEFEAVAAQTEAEEIAAQAMAEAAALRAELETADPLSAAKADYKTMLQEKLQAERRPAPRYAVIETMGPPHQRIFHVEVSWDSGSIRGTGHSIKAAEAAAGQPSIPLTGSRSVRQ